MGVSLRDKSIIWWKKSFHTLKLQAPYNLAWLWHNAPSFCTLFETTDPLLHLTVLFLKLQTLCLVWLYSFWNYRPFASSYCTLFETTDSLPHLTVFFLKLTTDHRLCSLCIMKLRTPWPFVPVHIETTDSMASSGCAYWNYGLHGLLWLRTPWPPYSVHIETTDSMASSVCACILKLRTPWPRLSVHIETTDSMVSSVCAYWNYGLHGLLCLCILKLRLHGLVCLCILKLQSLWPLVPVHIETTDSMVSSVFAYWNYGLHGLICLCILRTPRPHLSMHIETTDSMSSSVCAYWKYGLYGLICLCT